jgi:hypothetical protein
MDKLLSTIQVAAKTAGLLIGTLLLLLIIGNALDPVESGHFLQLSLKGWLVFILFPLGPVAGYLITIKKPFAGNVVVVCNMVVLLIARTDLFFSGISILALPAFVSLLIHYFRK